jgi:hypothetical protein
LKTICIKNSISLRGVKKKSQLLTRLAIWVRDEIASSPCTTSTTNDDDDEQQHDDKEISTILPKSFILARNPVDETTQIEPVLTPDIRDNIILTEDDEDTVDSNSEDEELEI